MERLILNNYVPYGQQRSKINLNFEEIFGRTDNLNNIDIYQYAVLEDGYTELFSTVNTLDTFEVLASDSLWLRVLVLKEGTIREERLYKFFKMKKGLYGQGGLQIGVDPSTFGIEILFIGAYKLNPEEDVRTQIVDLGWDITGTTISEFVNALPDEGIEFQDNINGLIVIKVIKDGVAEEYLYNGVGGIYGMNHLQTIPSDFNKFNSGNANTPIIYGLQDVLENGNETTLPIVIQGLSIGSNTAYSTQFGGGDFPAITTNTGLQQTAIGASAGGNNTGLNQLAIGINAGKDNVGTSQLAIGFGAGVNNVGPNQFAIGFNTGANNTANFQTAIGYSAGIGNTGSTQLAIGESSGRENTAIRQIAIGSSAGRSNTAANQVAIGTQAGKDNIGDYQTAIGPGAGLTNKGLSQTAMGSNAGKLNTGDYQIAFGGNSGNNNTGEYQIAIGRSAGSNNKGARQIAIGTFAGEANTFSDVIQIGTGTLTTHKKALATANNQLVLQTNSYPIRFDTDVAKALLFQLPLEPGRLVTEESVNLQRSYFLTEKITGAKWIDGKDIFTITKLASDPAPTGTETVFPNEVIGTTHIVYRYTKLTP